MLWGTVGSMFCDNGAVLSACVGVLSGAFFHRNNPNGDYRDVYCTLHDRRTDNTTDGICTRHGLGSGTWSGLLCTSACNLVVGSGDAAWNSENDGADFVCGLGAAGHIVQKKTGRECRGKKVEIIGNLHQICKKALHIQVAVLYSVVWTL